MAIPNPKNKIMRLNKQSKFHMLGVAEDEKYAAKRTNLLQEEYALAAEFYHFIYTQNNLKLMASLPREAFSMSSALSIGAHLPEETSKLARSRHGMYSDAWSPYKLHLNEPQPTFYTENHNIGDPEFPAALQKKFMKFMHKRISLTSEMLDYRNKLSQFFDGCKSVKHMLELLPKAYDWLPDHEGCTDTPVADLAAELI